jgi:hypothetical protein
MNGKGVSWRFALRKKRVGMIAQIMAANCRSWLLLADVWWGLTPEWGAAVSGQHSPATAGANLSI